MKELIFWFKYNIINLEKQGLGDGDMRVESEFESRNIKYLKDETLKDYTTFKIGGKARYIVFPTTTHQLMNALRIVKENNMSWFVVGNCSNVLISDRGFNGTIISTIDINSFSIEDDFIEAECGCLLTTIAKKACEANLKGLEFAVGIPGTVGGAIYMNAGAYGGEIKDVIQKVDVLDDNLNILRLTKDDLRFSYRHSRLQDESLILLKAYFKLQKAFEDCGYSAVQKANEYNKRRREKQPLQFPSAGSIFKRPDGSFAGKLIEEAGLKGFRIGDACISEKHAGFIVNMGNASAEDVRKLIYHAQKVVFEKFGILLEPEIKFIGEFETPLFVN